MQIYTYIHTYTHTHTHTHIYIYIYNLVEYRDHLLVPPLHYSLSVFCPSAMITISNHHLICLLFPWGAILKLMLAKHFYNLYLEREREREREGDGIKLKSEIKIKI